MERATAGLGEYHAYCRRLARNGQYAKGILEAWLVKIVWTKHAEERQKEWERKLGVSRQEVEDVLNEPEQIVPGDLGASVAQRRRGNGLLRAPFVESGNERKILTVYWTSKVERYWKGG